MPQIMPRVPLLSRPQARRDGQEMHRRYDAVSGTIFECIGESGAVGLPSSILPTAAAVFGRSTVNSESDPATDLDSTPAITKPAGQQADSGEENLWTGRTSWKHFVGGLAGLG